MLVSHYHMKQLSSLCFMREFHMSDIKQEEKGESYKAQQFKAFKSLEAYNQMVSGFITSAQGKIICDKFVVLGKVRHSQRMTECRCLVGSILSAHCLGCKAGLGETCSHIASILFYIGAWTRIHGKLACTQVKCTWLLPTYVSEVPYATEENINFRSAAKF